MHMWKNKPVISQIALACTLAIASQANAKDVSGSTYNTFGYDDTAATPWYYGYANWRDAGTAYGNGIYPVIKGSTVNGVISTYYLENGGADSHKLSISNSTINGMITSHCMTTECASGVDADGTNHMQYKRFELTVDNSTINDIYEHYAYTTTSGSTTTDAYWDTYHLGNAITLDVESDIVIQNNSHIAGITLTQGYHQLDNTPYDSVEGIANNNKIFTNTLVVKDSVLTSGAYSDLGTKGFYGQSAKPSDYAHSGASALDDAALIVTAASDADNAMQTKATFDHATITGDILFTSTFDNNFYRNGDPATDTTSDGVYNPTTNGWDDTDKLDVTLNNGSKWVGAAQSRVEAISTSQMYGWGYTGVDWRELKPNSIWPDSIFDANGHVSGNEVYQSGLFNVKLDNGSEWETRKSSNIDTLTVDRESKVDVKSSSLLADSITLSNGSTLSIRDEGEVATHHLKLDSYSRAHLTEETAELYANTITVDNRAELALGLGQVDTHKMVLTDGGVLNVASRNYVLNSDLHNERYATNDIHKAEYDYGVIALNSNGHLAVNGTTTGNYKVRIDNATGAGSVADYKNNEVIRVYNDNKGDYVKFTAANQADLGAYRYEARQTGDTVALHQGRLTDYANMALSIPSANTNIWNLQQDTLDARLTNGRHGLMDNGGAWVSYLGGNFDANNGTIQYDQDVHGIMVGLDTLVDGNYAKWTVGAAAGFAKGDVSNRTGKVDQDSQTAYVYSSARFANDVFVNGSLNYSRFSNDLSATMSNGHSVDGDTTSDAWGFGLKLGYDWKPNASGYVTPYAAVSGLFQSGDDYQVSNNMRVGSQSYDSLRYELGVDAGYTFNYGGDQAFTPYARLAYVHDDADNNTRVNGDKIKNDVDGSAVRVGLGTQFSFTKNFSAYADATYLGGGDVDQNWGANLGVKYTW